MDPSAASFQSHPLVKQASHAAGQAYDATRGASGRIYEAARASWATQRPWREMTDSFSAPKTAQEAASRIRRNTNYFFSNYVFVLVALWVVSLLLRPGSLFWIIVLTGGWLYLFVIRPADQPLEIMGTTLSSVEVAWAYSVTVILVCTLTSVGSVISSVLFFWIAVVLLHSSFREPDESHVDDGSHPFLSWLGGPNNLHQYAPVAPVAGA